jgi:hypothetical protein
MPKKDPSALKDEKDRIEKRKLALSVANSLVTRLLEKRFLNHESAPEALTFFCEKCLSLLIKINPQGYPGLKMAGDIAGRLIEAGRLSNKDAVVRHMEDHMLTLELIASTLPPETKKEILKISSDMVLKMLETITLSGTSIPKVLGNVAENAARFLEGKED